MDTHRRQLGRQEALEQSQLGIEMPGGSQQSGLARAGTGTRGFCCEADTGLLRGRAPSTVPWERPAWRARRPLEASLRVRFQSNRRPAALSWVKRGLGGPAGPVRFFPFTVCGRGLGAAAEVWEPATMFTAEATQGGVCGPRERPRLPLADSFLGCLCSLWWWGGGDDRALSPCFLLLNASSLKQLHSFCFCN